MHRCFNILEIFPALIPRDKLVEAFFNCLETHSYLKKFDGVSDWETSKMKSSKEFDKYGPPAKVWSSFVTRTALHE